jgi:hypothetical protein
MFGFHRFGHGFGPGGCCGPGSGHGHYGPGFDAKRFESFAAARSEGFQLIGAARQIARSGDQEQIDKVTQVLGTARRDLYRLLADEAGPETE